MHATICILEFMNFMLFLIKFIEFKQRIKFKKFELHNYAWCHTVLPTEPLRHGILSLCTRCMTLQFYFVILFHLSHVLHANYFHFNTK